MELDTQLYALYNNTLLLKSLESTIAEQKLAIEAILPAGKTIEELTAEMLLRKSEEVSVSANI